MPPVQRHLVVCIEGPSAVGKTTLAAALARECGAFIVPEVDASAAPAIADSAAWFIDAHAAQSAHARAANGASFSVLDGDPFKALWYNRVFAEQGWPGVDVVAPLYRTHLARGTITWPDLYVVLDATEVQLRARRSGDATRARRGFEHHLRLIEPLRDHFMTLAAAAPGHVVFVDSSKRETLIAVVREALGAVPPAPFDGLRVFDHLTAWMG